MISDENSLWRSLRKNSAVVKFLRLSLWHDGLKVSEGVWLIVTDRRLSFVQLNYDKSAETANSAIISWLCVFLKKVINHKAWQQSKLFMVISLPFLNSLIHSFLFEFQQKVKLLPLIESFVDYFTSSPNLRARVTFWLYILHCVFYLRMSYFLCFIF